MILSKKYKKAMDKISLNEEMKKKILTNINNLDNEKEFKDKKINIRNKIINNIGMYAAGLLIILCAIGNESIINNINGNNFGNNMENSQGIIENDIDSNKESTKENPEREPIKEYTTEDKSENILKDDIKNEKTNQIKNSITNKNIKEKNNNLKEDKSISSSLEYKDDKLIANSDNVNKEAEGEKNIIVESSENEGTNEDNNNLEPQKDTTLKASRSISKSFDSLENLKKEVDFKFKVPILDKQDFKISNINLINEKIVAISYSKLGNEFEFCTSEEKDSVVSSINDYKEKWEIEIENIKVSAEGSGDLINLLTWNDDNMFYRIVSSNGISEEVAVNIITNIKEFE